jgi:hypothetical protein
VARNEEVSARQYYILNINTQLFSLVESGLYLIEKYNEESASFILGQRHYTSIIFYIYNKTGIVYFQILA